MRSRDLRTFTVEVKNKRRHPAPSPASLWADAEALLKPAAASGDRGSGAGEPIQVRRPLLAAGAKADQPRRVLPDLRPARPEAIEVAAADPDRQAAREAGASAGADEAAPPRPSRRGRSTAPPDSARQPKRSARRSALSIAVSAASVAAAEPPVSAIVVKAAAAPEGSVAGFSAAGDTPIIVPADAAKPTRRWARRVEDLPRGERWKRRLPDVCR